MLSSFYRGKGLGCGWERDGGWKGHFNTVEIKIIYSPSRFGIGTFILQQLSTSLHHRHSIK